MIDKALSFLRQELNAYVKLKSNDNNKKVSLSAIVNQSGSLVPKEPMIVMMLVNIEEEKMMRAPAPQTVLVNGKYAIVNPELRLNLNVLFAAHNDDHFEALKLLALVTKFFQGRNVFNYQNFPQLEEEIEEIAVDLYTLNFEQQNQLWASIGAKYMPSLLYKVRLVAVNEKLPLSANTAITEIETAFANKTE